MNISRRQILILLPAAAVVKDSLTTEISANSRSRKMFCTCRLTFCLVVWNNSDDLADCSTSERHKYVAGLDQNIPE